MERYCSLNFRIISISQHISRFLPFNTFFNTGTAPNIARNAIVNCTELVTYDFIKDALLRSTPLTGKALATTRWDRGVWCLQSDNSEPPPHR